MKENKFFEVFPTLKLNQDLNELFSQVNVMKITQNPRKSSIRIYIQSDRLIVKGYIFQMEEAIKKQIFYKVDDEIKIIEKFNLSSQYNLSTLMAAYRDSILLELKNVDHVGYSIFKKAKIQIPEEDVLQLTVTESLIVREKCSWLEAVLDKILNDRCALNAHISLLYEQGALTAVHREEEIKIKNEVNAILSNLTEQEIPKKEDVAPEGRKQKKVPANLIYGRDFEGEGVLLKDILNEMEDVIISGKIISSEQRETKTGKHIIIFNITDFSDSITVKLFLKPEQYQSVAEEIQTGRFVKIKGTTLIDKFDNELTIGSIVGVKKTSDFSVKRTDNCAEKRVELHSHTKMSDMDGMTEVGDLIHRAIEWGHKALAITDHGVVQAFTDAFHVYQDIRKKYKAKEKNLDFKIIYGVEAYLVDDIKETIKNSRGQTLEDTYVIFDIETTGLSAKKNKIIEIGAVKIRNGIVVDKYSTFVNPKEPIPYPIEKLTGINDRMVLSAPTISQVLPEFIEFCSEAVLVAHNAEFDVSFIIENANLLKIKTDFTVIDTVALSRMLLPNLKRYKLDSVAKELNVPLDNHHRAVDDAGCTALIFLKLVEMLKARNIYTLDAINEQGKVSEEMIKKLPTHHSIILAKNEVGRINLYTLISHSHIKYFNRTPRIPKSDFLKHREGLIIGSACEAGELYQALLQGKSNEDITRLAKFYDYYEIQPLDNNAFMLDNEKTSVSSKEDLKELNRKIVRLGEDFNKPVVATCDVHFLNPEDEIYRRIIMAGKGFSDADNQAPLYFRTTQEMLDEFQYLGEEKAKEVVVTNTNIIADMIEEIDPVRPDKCPPVIPDSDKTLRDLCYQKAHSMYGNPLPRLVTERLERELNSIISNGFAVMYIIAQKLVWKSNEDGYLVGSRGSVGSSFVATMSGITEVNPLKPHYYCPSCHYSDFDSEEVKKYQGGSGCDMPDRVCPVCGQDLEKDGFDIPFETFLGFKGNKEPDIDLNFSGEYQSKAHDYTEEIFGKGQTFRAGTIATLQDKTAFGYVKKYYEERGISKRKSEIARILGGCVGVRRSTGQHPGGIIVLPHGEDINSFTPVQRPANDMNTKTVTTHFDYHSIDHNLLKLDILGHDDPTMIRKLELLTGVDAKSIKFDNSEVMSLFESTKALGIEPDDIDGCPLGALGIPEFGTEFVIQMLIDTKPKTFSDLVRISGLSHGTDVWLSNAQTLIKEGKATISTAICTRDDIMIYLINKGIDPELSFTIMESVRKGKGLKPEWEEEMLRADVPEWYIWSCKKIQYMFPKAHAVAYVMMAFRIAYFKVFYPLAYYAAYFSIRASAFNYEIMCLGKDKLNYYFKEYKTKNAEGTLTNKEQDVLKDMRIVQEMYARGFEFIPIDIYRAKAFDFQIVEGKLMPSLLTIDGLGDKAAEAVEQAAKEGRFLSKDDFRQRCKVSKTVIELMDNLGLLGGLPETNQLSLFDL